MGEAFFDHLAAEVFVAEYLDRGLGQVLRVARSKAQAGAFDRHDLFQPAGVGGDAGAFGGHRFERDQAEGLVD